MKKTNAAKPTAAIRATATQRPGTTARVRTPMGTVEDGGVSLLEAF
ncbi:MAG TPA: hypothetical protein VGA25_05990 [Burkholderiales bacterium]